MSAPVEFAGIDWAGRQIRIEYGTLAQIRGIASRVPQTLLLELPGCGHSPHRDQPDRLIAAITAFL